MKPQARSRSRNPNLPKSTSPAPTGDSRQGLVKPLHYWKGKKYLLYPNNQSEGLVFSSKRRDDPIGGADIADFLFQGNLGEHSPARAESSLQGRGSSCLAELCSCCEFPDTASAPSEPGLCLGVHAKAQGRSALLWWEGNLAEPSWKGSRSCWGASEQGNQRRISQRLINPWEQQNHGRTLQRGCSTQGTALPQAGGSPQGTQRQLLHPGVPEGPPTMPWSSALPRNQPRLAWDSRPSLIFCGSSGSL